MWLDFSFFGNGLVLFCFLVWIIYYFWSGLVNVVGFYVAVLRCIIGLCNWVYYIHNQIRVNIGCSSCNR